MLTPEQTAQAMTYPEGLQRQMIMARFAADNETAARIEAAKVDDPAKVQQAQSYFEQLKANPTSPEARQGLLSLGIVPYSGWSVEGNALGQMPGYRPSENFGIISPGLWAIQEKILKAGGGSWSQLDPSIRYASIYPDIPYFGTPLGWVYPGSGYAGEEGHVSKYSDNAGATMTVQGGVITSTSGNIGTFFGGADGGGSKTAPKGGGDLPGGNGSFDYFGQTIGVGSKVGDISSSFIDTAQASARANGGRGISYGENTYSNRLNLRAVNPAISYFKPTGSPLTMGDFYNELGKNKAYTPAGEIGNPAMQGISRFIGAVGMNSQFLPPNVFTGVKDRYSALAASGSILAQGEAQQGNKSRYQYYINERNKALQDISVLSSTYHHVTAKSGQPYSGNPFEISGDYAVTIMKGGPTKESENFSPFIGGITPYLPNGKGTQQVAWNDAVKGTYAGGEISFLPAIQQMAMAWGRTPTTRDENGNLISFANPSRTIPGIYGQFGMQASEPKPQLTQKQSDMVDKALSMAGLAMDINKHIASENISNENLMGLPALFKTPSVSTSPEVYRPSELTLAYSNTFAGVPYFGGFLTNVAAFISPGTMEKTTRTETQLPFQNLYRNNPADFSGKLIGDTGIVTSLPSIPMGAPYQKGGKTYQDYTAPVNFNALPVVLTTTESRPAEGGFAYGEQQFAQATTMNLPAMNPAKPTGILALDYIAGFGRGQYEGLREKPLTAAISYGITLGIIAGGELIAPVVPGITAATSGTRYAPIGTGLSWAARNNIVPLGMVGFYGQNVKERVTAGGTDYSPAAAERFGEIFSTELVPMLAAGASYGAMYNGLRMQEINIKSAIQEGRATGVMNYYGQEVMRPIEYAKIDYASFNQEGRGGLGDYLSYQSTKPIRLAEISLKSAFQEFGQPSPKGMGVPETVPSAFKGTTPEPSGTRMGNKVVGGRTVSGLTPEPSLKSMGISESSQTPGTRSGRFRSTKFPEPAGGMKPWDLSRAGGKQSAISLQIMSEQLPITEQAMAKGTAPAQSTFIQLGMLPPRQLVSNTPAIIPLTSEFIGSYETKKRQGLISVIEPEFFVEPQSDIGMSFMQSYADAQRQRKMETGSQMMAGGVLQEQRNQQFTNNLLAVSPVSMFGQTSGNMLKQTSEQAIKQASEQASRQAQTPRQTTIQIPGLITTQIPRKITTQEPRPPPPPGTPVVPPLLFGFPSGASGGGLGGVGINLYGFREHSPAWTPGEMGMAMITGKFPGRSVQNLNLQGILNIGRTSPRQAARTQRSPTSARGASLSLSGSVQKLEKEMPKFYRAAGKKGIIVATPKGIVGQHAPGRRTPRLQHAPVRAQRQTQMQSVPSFGNQPTKGKRKKRGLFDELL